MKLQKEMVFIGQLLGEMINGLQEGAAKTALIAHTSMCLAQIEDALRTAYPDDEGQVIVEEVTVTVED